MTQRGGRPPGWSKWDWRIWNAYGAFLLVGVPLILVGLIVLAIVR